MEKIIKTSSPISKIILIIFLGVFLICASAAVFTVEPHQRAIVHRIGLPKRVVLPGLHVKIPFIEQVYYCDIRGQELNVPAVEAQMSDLTRITVEASASYVIVDCLRFYKTAKYFESLEAILSKKLISTLHETLWRYSFTDLSDNRDKIVGDVKAQMTRTAENLGAELTEVNLFFSKR